jgi:predicted nucleic acid-binding protein
VATCSIIDLEVLYSARSAQSYAAAPTERRLALELLAIEQPTLDRALAVQAALAQRAEHRGASLPDLIVAAAAERPQVTLLHYDLIASVTRQPVNGWSRGSL